MAGPRRVADDAPPAVSRDGEQLRKIKAFDRFIDIKTRGVF